MAFLDPSKFSLGNEPPMRAFQDRLLELRRGLPPDIAAGQPPLPGMPKQTTQQERQQDIGQQINQAAQMVAQQAAAATPNAQGKPDKKAGDAALQEFNSLLDQVNPFKEKPRFGSGAVGKFLTGEDRGGIFGTGMMPIDVLAFAIGAGITSNLPQDQAIKRTMDIAMLPSQLRDSQVKNAQEFIAAKLQAINAGTQMQNAETARVNAAQAQQKYGAKTQLGQAFRLAGRHAEALAIEADAVSEYVKLTGGSSPDRLPPHLESALDNVLANPQAPIPDWMMHAVGTNDPQEARQRVFRWRSQNLGSRQPIPTPSGDALVLTPGGPVPIQDAPRLPGANVLQPGAQRPQQPIVPPAAGQPVQPDVRTIDPRTDVQQPGQAPGLLGQLSQSQSKQDQWAANYAPELLPSTQDKLSDLYKRPLPPELKQRLLAQHAAADYGKQLEAAYNDMVKSYGGDAKYTVKPGLTQYLMNLSTRLSGEGISGGFMTLTADAIGAMAQRYGTTLTPEALHFSGLFAQAQKFARGAMNDAANLATRERTMFNTMVGTPLDLPSVFRSRIQNFYKNIADEHNRTLRANSMYGLKGLELVDLPGRTQQPQSRTTEMPGGRLTDEWEVIAPPPSVGGTY